MSPTPSSPPTSRKLNAAEYIQRMKIVDDRDKAFNPIADQLLRAAAHIVLTVFLVIAFLRARFRQALYSLERNYVFNDCTPQQVRLDVAGMPKVPANIGFVLDAVPLSDTAAASHRINGTFPASEAGIDFRVAQSMEMDIVQLIRQAVECLGWVAGAGASQLTLYERSGLLKQIEPDLLVSTLQNGLAKKFPEGSRPNIVLRHGTEYVSSTPLSGNEKITVTLLSSEDGRQMLVNLANEFRTKVKEGTAKKEDITVDNVHRIITERVGNEPDLLVTFGSHLDFEEFSPWLLRVTELFCLPDNDGVFHYMVFYRALQKFSHVKVNLGA